MIVEILQTNKNLINNMIHMNTRIIIIKYYIILMIPIKNTPIYI